jgi:signal transduction histidine kinase/ActR/RegA family two-component response regulator
MINFVQVDKRHLSFEINRSNIVYEGLIISNDVLLHGGSEIEVATLYKAMEASLRNIKDQVVLQRRDLKEQQAKFASQQIQLEQQIAEAEQQRRLVTSLVAKIAQAEASLSEKNERIAIREASLKVLELELSQKRRQFEDSQQALNSSQQVLETQRHELTELQQQIETNTAVLDAQQLKLEAQRLELDQKIEVVSRQEETIASQRNVIVVFLMLLLLVTFFIIVRQKQTLARERLLLKAEAELVVAQRESIAAYESSLKIKNDFLTAINHELRTPMNGILGAVQVAQKTDVESLISAIDLIDKSANEMMQLVDDILTYTEIQSQQLVACNTEGSLQDICDALYDHYNEVCRARQLELRWRVGDRVPNYVEIDLRKLEKILRKLLDNAVKFTQEGFVSFLASVNDAESCLEFTVEDSGPGIDPSQEQHLFEAFNQLETGFTRTYGGMGIGLSICKSLSEVMGGNVRLNAHRIIEHDEALAGLPQGCSISLTLPYKALSEAPLLSPDILTHSTERRPILIVEDNVVNQKILQKMLFRIGYHSIVAGDGRQALDAMSVTSPALVLMDLQMPVMDGFSCTRHIRAREDENRSVPIIALTANLIDSQQSSCIEVGMNAYLGKPVDLTVLKNTIHRFIAPGDFIERRS